MQKKVDQEKTKQAIRAHKQHPDHQPEVRITQTRGSFGRGRTADRYRQPCEALRARPRAPRGNERAGYRPSGRRVTRRRLLKGNATLGLKGEVLRKSGISATRKGPGEKGRQTHTASQDTSGGSERGNGGRESAESEKLGEESIFPKIKTRRSKERGWAIRVPVAGLGIGGEFSRGPREQQK